MDVFTSTNADQVKLEDLVGEGKKYKDVNELAKAYVHSETHKAQILQEKQEAVNELATRAAVEDAIKKLQGTNANVSTNVQTGVIANQTQTTDVKATLTLEDVDKLLEDRQRKQKETINLNAVNEAIVKYAGTAEKGRDFLAAKAKELGFPVDKLAELGKESPAALLRILGVNEKVVNTPVTPVTRTTANTAIGNKTYDLDAPMSKKDYDELRKTEPSLYFSPKIQNKLMKDRMSELRKQQN